MKFNDVRVGEGGPFPCPVVHLFDCIPLPHNLPGNFLSLFKMLIFFFLSILTKTKKFH